MVLRKSTKGLMAVCLAVLILILPNPLGSRSESLKKSSLWTVNEKVTYSGGTAKFTAIHVDLKDPKIQLEVSTADDHIGKVDTLPNLVAAVTDEDGTGIAGINGTFFNAYSDLQPLGTIIQNGEVLHLSNTGSTFGVGPQNEIKIEDTYTAISGSTMDQWVWPYNWYSWSINHFYGNKDATMIFDAHYKGVKPEHDFSVVSVSSGIVTKIDKGSFNIPPEGFIILTNDKKILEKFNLGTQATYKFDFFKKDRGQVGVKTPVEDWKEVMTAIGAGPTLVKGGKIIADPKGEGFTEAKILTNKGQRSFVGMTKDRELIMASVANVNVYQLAEIALKMKCVMAINFDGGASSGTFANGKTLVATGRKISNALVVKALKTNPIAYQLNGQYFYLKESPYWNAKSQKLYVPVRQLDRYLNGYQTLPSKLQLSEPSFTRNKETYVSLADALKLLGIEGYWDAKGQMLQFKK